MTELINPIAVVSFLSSLYLCVLLSIYSIEIIKSRFIIKILAIMSLTFSVSLFVLNNKALLPPIKNYYYLYYTLMSLFVIMAFIFLLVLIFSNFFRLRLSCYECAVALIIAIAVPRIYLPYYQLHLEESLRSSLSQELITFSITKCDELLKFNPSNIRLMKLKADLVEKEKQIIHELNDSSNYPSIRKASLLAQLGQFDSALLELYRINDTTLEYYLLRGSILIQQKKYYYAISQYKYGLKLLNADPVSSQKTRLLQRRCLSSISFCEIQIGNYTGAIEARMAISLIDPVNTLEDQFEIAAIYYQAGDSRTALEQLSKIKPLLTPVLQKKADAIIKRIQLENSSCVLGRK